MPGAAEVHDLLAGAVLQVAHLLTQRGAARQHLDQPVGVAAAQAGAVFLGELLDRLAGPVDALLPPHQQRPERDVRGHRREPAPTRVADQPQVPHRGERAGRRLGRDPQLLGEVGRLRLARADE
ncbi:hypothetical protein [Nonomuraea sp. NPDC023979]|uniref:hypothetical protein n=1 Tax=Nonomuraea sp. NPDC023979 TaxID=3154796 RepID=UPI0033F4696F